MLRRPAMVVVMLLVSLVMACAPQAGSSTPTPAGTGAVPKAASGAVSVATPKPAAEKPQRGGTLVYANTGEPGELDPHRLASAQTRYVSQLMYNSLVNTDKDGNIVPELAESWSFPDPKTAVFKLRKGVKFHDGTDFNAQAVKFNVERMKDPATASLARSVLANITSVEVADDYTVKFNLGTPQASLLGELAAIRALGFVSPAAVKKLGNLEALSNPVGMGTGPFEFVEWVKDDHITLKRFDGFWRKDQYGEPLPYLDQVIIKPIPDSSAMLTNLRTGNVDAIANVLASQLPIVQEDKNLKIVESGGVGTAMELNLAKPPFDNKALRQAVAWAIDRQIIHKSIYGGSGAAAQYLLDSGSWAFDPTGKFYAKDNAKAKQKLVEGGKPDGFKFAANVFSIPFELLLAQALKGQLAEVGIDMEIVPLEQSKHVLERKAGRFEAAMFWTGASISPDPDIPIYGWFDTKGSTRTSSYNNPEVDNLLEKARAIYDQAERKALYAKAQALIIDDSPMIWVHHTPGVSAMNQKVMGFAPASDPYHFMFDWIWLKR